MKHLLVPIGSTENATNTLQYAIDLASKIGAKVFVFRAYKLLAKAGTIINVDQIVTRETQLYLRSVVNQVNTRNVDVKIISAKGSAVESISAIDKELGVDLIVIGPRSNSTKEEVFLGSTTGSIVKTTDIPVLIVPEGYKFKAYKKSVIAFKSGVLNNKEMLNPLKTLTVIFSSKVNLLHVKTPDIMEDDLKLDIALEEIKHTYTSTENLTIFKGVLDYFTTNTADLLCVFRRKRGFFQKLWEKNTILKTEFNCSIPMLVLNRS